MSLADLALAASRFCAAALNLDRRLKAGPVVSANGGRGSVNIQLVKSKTFHVRGITDGILALSRRSSHLSPNRSRVPVHRKSQGRQTVLYLHPFNLPFGKTGLQRVTEALKEKSERVGYTSVKCGHFPVFGAIRCAVEYLGHHDHPCPPRRKISDGLNLFRGWIYALIIGTRRYGRVAGGAHASPRTPIVGFFFMRNYI